jgi:GAF domain-containing protein
MSTGHEKKAPAGDGEPSSRLEEQNHELRGQLDELQSRHRELQAELVRLQRHSTTLANLYVASRQLAASADRREVLGAIQDVVCNLIGSEELGIYELDADSRTLKLVAAMGAEAVRSPTVALGDGEIGSAAESGATFLGDGDEPALVACVPLKLDERVIGALAIFRLLPQKPELEAFDRELLELLATQAAAALHRSADRERSPGRVPA